MDLLYVKAGHFNVGFRIRWDGTNRFFPLKSVFNTSKRFLHVCLLAYTQANPVGLA